ncbi:hypothetical protein AVEN_46833-1 [Araneus ventricosus]|uniref:Uncharacterized protein n=1 Tax=Araneus ventricosus TaxID=182803 RepID=A0A4Y2M916_ARAVE|nr:hypothetical protein AVEN_46833-1 [Araneus ventricosus]
MIGRSFCCDGSNDREGKIDYHRFVPDGSKCGDKRKKGVSMLARDQMTREKTKDSAANHCLIHSRRSRATESRSSFSLQGAVLAQIRQTPVSYPNFLSKWTELNHS